MSSAPCRANISERCEIYGSTESGTFDGQRLICMSCYSLLLDYSPSGRCLLGEMDEALDNFKKGKKVAPLDDPILAIARRVRDGLS